MTPKEKAKQLYEKYEFVYIQNYTSKHEVKECVLIAVNEIIESHETLGYTDECIEFWQNVISEVEMI
jgi:hypothetical protein